MLIVIISMVLAGCSHDQTQEPESSQRTLLIYMAANNSLVGFANDDLAEIRLAMNTKSTPKGHVLVLKSTPSSPTPHLYEITTKEGDKLLKEYVDYNTAVDANLLSEVVADARRLTLNQSLGLVLWSHSMGWGDETSIPYEGDKTKAPMLKTWGFDNNELRKMSVNDLAQALRGTHLDFIYFDCCFMGGIEVLYALRDVTPYIIASPTETPAEGMPYDQNIPLMLQDELDLESVVGNTFNYYMRLTDTDLRSISISLYSTTNVSELWHLACEMGIAGENINTPLYSAEIPQYGFDSDTGRYGGKYYDLYSAAMRQGSVSERMGFDEIFNKVVLLNLHTPSMWGFSLDGTHGLSVCPNNRK